MNELAPLVEIFAEIEPWRGTTMDGSFANFLGVMTDLEFVERHHPSNTAQEVGNGALEIQTPKVEDGEPFFEFAAIYSHSSNSPRFTGPLWRHGGGS